MKYSRPLQEYSLSPLGYSCNIGQKTQHPWKSLPAFLTPELRLYFLMCYTICLLAVYDFLVLFFAPLFAFFQEGKENRDWGASWNNAPPFASCHIRWIPAFTKCVHRAEGPLSCLVFLLWPVWIDHCTVIYYSSRRRALFLGLYFFPD